MTAGRVYDENYRSTDNSNPRLIPSNTYVVTATLFPTDVLLVKLSSSPDRHMNTAEHAPHPTISS